MKKMISKKKKIKMTNNAVFGKTMETVTENGDTKLAPANARRNYLVSEPNYHTTKICSGNLLAIETKRTKILINESVSLGLSNLKISKVVMYDFWYGYLEPKYGEKAKLRYAT